MGAKQSSASQHCAVRRCGSIKLTIERYGPGFKGMDDPTSELEIMVPVRHK